MSEDESYQRLQTINDGFRSAYMLGLVMLIWILNCVCVALAVAVVLLVK